MASSRRTTVGVLALQGDFREHIAVLGRLGVDTAEVLTPDELAAVDGLIIPGGESTTIGRLATLYGMVDAIRTRVLSGMPMFGTCAGMIVMGAATTGPIQPQLGVLDVVVERNAFGRQVASFEADLDVAGFETPMRAVFIRAPWIAKVGGQVEVLATVQDPDTGIERPVVVRQGTLLASSFHPELTRDTRLHQMLIDMVQEN